jgi:hypothetical protein
VAAVATICVDRELPQSGSARAASADLDYTLQTERRVAARVASPIKEEWAINLHSPSKCRYCRQAMCMEKHMWQHEVENFY